MRAVQIQKVMAQIEQTADKYPELRRALIQRFGKASQSISMDANAIKEELKLIREELGLEKDITFSIDYGFVTEDAIRCILKRYNLKMEYEVLRICKEEKDDERYMKYCFYAFLQVECLTKWVLKELYKTPEEFRDAYNDKQREQFRLEGKESVQDVHIANLLYFVNKSKKIFTEGVTYLRIIRNNIAHPSTTVERKNVPPKYQKKLEEKGLFFIEENKEVIKIEDYRQQCYPTIESLVHILPEYVAMLKKCLLDSHQCQEK